MSHTTRTLTNSMTGEEAEVEVTDSPQDSIEISVNAKGEPSWTVKVYAHDDQEAGDRLAKMRRLAEFHATEIRATKGAQ